MKKIPSVWVGKEVEGYYSGLKTLFIGSKKIIYGEIESYVHDFDVEQIYFGAGGCTEINYETLRTVIHKISNVKITVEADIHTLHTIPEDIIANKTVNFIITNTHRNYELLPLFNRRNVQMKVQFIGEVNKVLAIGSLYHYTFVNMNSHLKETYRGDRVLQ